MVSQCRRLQKGLAQLSACAGSRYRFFFVFPPKSLRSFCACSLFWRVPSIPWPIGSGTGK